MKPRLTLRSNQIRLVRLNLPRPLRTHRLRLHHLRFDTRPLQHRLQILARRRDRGLRNRLGRAFGDDLAAVDAAAGAKVDHPVGGLDDVEVVLDHDHGVAGVDQAVEDVEELADVLEVEAGGRLVEDVEGLAGGAAGELLAELDALRLAAAERGRALADLDVAEPDLLQHAHLVADRGDRLEQLGRFLDVHVEHVGDRVALELHLERLAVVARAVAHVAGDVDVGQEVHLDLDQAVALARLAAAALDVEAEAAGLVAAGLALRQAGEPVADLGEGAGVGRGVGARRAADRRLVDVDHLVELLKPGDLAAGAAGDAGAVQRAGGAGVERVDGEARLARAGNAGDAGEGAEREGGGDARQ